MAEEAKTVAQGKKKGGLIAKLAVLAAAIIIPAVAGLLLFQFVLAPRLTETEVVDEQELEEKIPITAVTAEFDSQIATLVMPADANVPASLLLYQVALECANPETLALVDRFRPRFLDMIRELHANKTRAEVDDPLILDSIKKQILQRSNTILNRAQAQPDPNFRVTAVFHTQWTVQDQ
jgi:flagellar basal body-associated protein FliL